MMLSNSKSIWLLVVVLNQPPLPRKVALKYVPNSDLTYFRIFDRLVQAVGPLALGRMRRRQRTEQTNFH